MAIRIRTTLLLLLSSCATGEPYTGDYWVCNALSPTQETHRAQGHWGSCEDGEWCAREEALKKCLWKHPKDCEIRTCVKSPALEAPPKLTTDETLDDETATTPPKKQL